MGKLKFDRTGRVKFTAIMRTIFNQNASFHFELDFCRPDLPAFLLSIMLTRASDILI